MAILKWIDYIWFVGESFHRREKSPGDGVFPFLPFQVHGKASG